MKNIQNTAFLAICFIALSSFTFQSISSENLIGKWKSSNVSIDTGSEEVPADKKEMAEKMARMLFGNFSLHLFKNYNAEMIMSIGDQEKIENGTWAFDEAAQELLITKNSTKRFIVLSCSSSELVFKFVDPKSADRDAGIIVTLSKQ